MDSRIVIGNSTESGSYDAFAGDLVVGTIVYEQRGGRVVIRHTVVDPQFRGQGIASALARFALDDLAAAGKTLTNYCGFIADYIGRNPGYARLIDAARPGRALPRDAALRAAGSRPGVSGVSGAGKVSSAAEASGADAGDQDAR